MNKRPALIIFTILFVVAVGMILFKTTSKAPATAPNGVVLDIGDTLTNQMPTNILPISIDVAANQAGRKVLLVHNGALTFDGVANVPMFAEGSFPITFEDELGATVAQGLAGPKGEWMTSDPVQFTALLQVKPITEPVIGNLVFKRDNLSGLPEHDFEFKMPAVLQNK